jgi:hypothetical protein
VSVVVKVKGNERKNRVVRCRDITLRRQKVDSLHFRNGRKSTLYNTCIYRAMLGHFRVHVIFVPRAPPQELF